MTGVVSTALKQTQARMIQKPLRWVEVGDSARYLLAWAPVRMAYYGLAIFDLIAFYLFFKIFNLN